jgi:hypothetical protein
MLNSKDYYQKSQRSFQWKEQANNLKIKPMNEMKLATNLWGWMDENQVPVYKQKLFYIDQ